jgi:hypothetical protein
MFEQYHDATRLIVKNRDVLFIVGFFGIGRWRFAEGLSVPGGQIRWGEV